LLPIFRCLKLFLIVLLLGNVSWSGAAPITYNINLTIGGGTAVGDIVTDGTIGALSTADILDWDLTLSIDSTEYTLLGPLSGSNSIVDNEDLYGHGLLQATASELLYSFGGGFGGLYFNPDDPDGGNLEFSNEGVPAYLNPDGELVAVNDVIPAEYIYLNGLQVIATASSDSVPEPASLALAGLGIMFMLFSRGLAMRSGMRQLVTKLAGCCGGCFSQFPGGPRRRDRPR
jgi:hypothetical protein